MKKSQGTAGRSCRCVLVCLALSAFTVWSFHVVFPSAFPDNTFVQSSEASDISDEALQANKSRILDDNYGNSSLGAVISRSEKLEVSADVSADKYNRESNHSVSEVPRSLEFKSGSLLSECDGRRIYMHELPPEFNTLSLNQCEAYDSWVNFCPHDKNWGFGEKTHRRSKSWYRTDAFMVEIIFHKRMMHYPCLTFSAEEADLVYIPYYSGLDALRYLYGNDIEKSGEHGMELVAWLQKNAKLIWERKGGRDHFVVMGRSAWDFSRPLRRKEGWGTSLLELPGMLNVTCLVLESRSWPWQEQAIPYPTSFHPRSKTNLYMWMNRVRRSPRTFLMAFAGGGGLGKSPNIRHSIRMECKDLPAGCAFIDCEDNKCDHDPGYLMRTMMKADFCLQPPGDTPTRRSTFDGIIAGCIPVFFEKQAAYTQYTWHLPSDPRDYSVLIPKDDVVLGGLKIAHVLGNYSREEVLRLRNNVINLIPRVIYRNPETSADAMEKDAFDVAIDRMLGRLDNQSRYYNDV
eukprot:Gb_07528 [translate_table: standard]